MRKLVRLAFTLALVLSAFAGKQAAPQVSRRPITLDDLARLRAVGDPQVSPDGKWIAYTTNETGDLEVYVQPFPATGEKWKVSSHAAPHRWKRQMP